MNRLGIDFISVLGMPPVAHVQLARRLGVGNISVAPAPFTANPHNYPGWSLRDDAGLRRNLKAALAGEGIALANGEGFLIRPGSDVADCVADLDLMAEIGSQRVNILTIDPDLSRSTDELGRFALLAGERGLAVTFEFMAGMAVGTLGAALDMIRTTGQAHVTLMLDAMHLARSGGTPADVAQADPALIGYLQLCDTKHKPIDATYGEEARHNRLALGTGDLPLADLIAAVPGHVPVGLELPIGMAYVQLVRRPGAGNGSLALARAMLGDA